MCKQANKPAVQKRLKSGRKAEQQTKSDFGQSQKTKGDLLPKKHTKANFLYFGTLRGAALQYGEKQEEGRHRQAGQH